MKKYVYSRHFFPHPPPVPLGDPTCYAPVIDYVRQMAEDLTPERNDYCVLLVVTDGGIRDMEETKRLIVENSHLPMSVILVGVGSVKASDARKLELLDDDRRTLTFRGVRPDRDIVQYVEMENYLPGECLDPKTFQSVMDGANAKYHLAKVSGWRTVGTPRLLLPDRTFVWGGLFTLS